MDWNLFARNLSLVETFCQCCSGVNFTDPDVTQCSYWGIYKMMDEEQLVNIRPKEQKSRSDSKVLRNKGNQAYKIKDNKTAHRLYTNAVCAAPPNSIESALAYANRSAVTYDMKKYNDSMRDISRALSNDNYPDELRHKLYERRGKCFLALKQFSKALADFKLAINRLQNKEHVSDKIAQIHGIMESCQDKRDVPQPPFRSTIQLSHTQSPEIQSASVAVKIDCFPGMGRGVVATRDIKPGDILAIENRYVSTLMADNCLDHCDNCMKECLSAIPCSSCNTVVYCSEGCRLSSWAAYHSMECRILPTLNAFLLPSCMEAEGTAKAHLALRLFLLASKCGAGVERLLERKIVGESVHSGSGFVGGRYLSDNYEPFHYLVTNLEEIDSNILVVFGALAVYLMSLLKEGTEFFESLDSTKPRINELLSDLHPNSDINLMHLTVADSLLKFWLIVNANVLAVSDPVSYDTTGVAMFAFYSLFNHSCNPDIVVYPYSSDSVFFMAIQPVKEGHQVFGNFGFSYAQQPRSYRRGKLDILQHFTCQCTACVEDWPTDDRWPVYPILKQPGCVQIHTLVQTAQSIEPICQNIAQGSGTQEDLNFLIQFMTYIFEKVKLPWGPYRKCQDAVKVYRRLQALCNREHQNYI